MVLLRVAARSVICHQCRQRALLLSSFNNRAVRSSLPIPGVVPVQRVFFTSPTKRSSGEGPVEQHIRDLHERRESVQTENGQNEDEHEEDRKVEYEGGGLAMNTSADMISSAEAYRTDGLSHRQGEGEKEVPSHRQEEGEKEEQPPETVKYVPWYLQVDPQVQLQEKTPSNRQRIPELPDHPPPILAPLLERLSVNLGIDDLTLLDLREIDPPPALGANLLLIFGTARSEKHLQFSADKLCRWLRSEHYLTPYADGLLGRQEIKLKVRRRAKRSRLFSSVGTKPIADTDLDEGIRTKWVCVNIGRVEGGDLPKTEEQLEREKKIVGFNSTTTGSSIVVQLLTEEKRGELELERVWAAVLKNSKRLKDELQAVDDVRSDPDPSSPPFPI